jgi:hypothetical protein
VTNTRRFLRARKFDVPSAYDQLVKAEEWRKDNDIEELFENVDIDEFERTRRLVSGVSTPFLRCKESDDR